MTRGGGLTLSPVYSEAEINEWGSGMTIMKDPPLKIGKYRDGSLDETSHEDVEGNKKWWCEFGHSRRGLEVRIGHEEQFSRVKNAAHQNRHDAPHVRYEV